MKRVIGTVVVAVLLLTAGYVLAAQQVVMDIKGMTCELCPLAIRKSLEKVAGVKSVKVSFDDKKARLAVDEAVTDKALEQAVQKAGTYTGKVIERKQTR
ncbi:heavy-metal-associated domain-containing protein [Geobacter argillaceus]|uniref:Mercuric ion binding protein n=1 Tax=Geobacter argillaceus TaxID=345631 RepID=A0A562WT04_9BACT|nr:heavy metal-associated domain-containing protein [Geobacter argillaceus]TWJ33486.1 mercuric ion binding protein [Geobacter argillaceus]